MRNLTFTRFRGVQSPSSWHQKFIGALLVLCMSVGFTADTYAQITLTATVEDVSCDPAPCPPDADGAIDLTITGGAEPYNIQWSFNGVDLPTCEEPAFDELNGVGSLDLGGVDNTVVEDAIATRNYIIQGSALTVNDASFNGGADVDEEIINNSQETSIIGLRTGVDHPDIIGGPNAANMTRTFTFDPPVSNLRMFFNDLDNNDVVIVNPKLGGAVQTLTPDQYTIVDPSQVGLTQVDARGNADPNMFTSLVDQQLGPETTSGIDFVFTGPIDEIELIFYDDVAGPGIAGSEGGSYTVNFPGQCREDLACIEAGTYAVVVTDADGATATETFTVTSPNCTFDLSAEITDVSCDPTPCPPDADGAIDLTINGGVEPYDIQWSFNGVDLPTCEEPAFDELNGVGSLDLGGVDNTVVEDAIATRNYIIQGSALTVNDASFNGGADIDEEIINNSQETSIIGLRTGVDHDEIIGGPNAANMTRTFTFDPPVSNLRMFLNDLDNNDIAIVNPKLNGVVQTLTTSEYSIVNTAQVSRAITDEQGNSSPNLFASDIDQPLNATTDGGINFVFAGPVDEIEIIFYDDVAGPGVVGSEGGSYTVNFPGQCREDLACIEAGTYIVEVTDANGATAVATYVVDPVVGCNPPTQVTIPCGATEGTITVSPSFGVAPYTFGWEDANGNPLPLPAPCTERDWASFESLNGTGANPVPGGVDNSIVENAINTQPFVIQGAVMTVNNVVFNGGASIDEEIINDTQLNGTFALRTGVDHEGTTGGIGGANMVRTITFSKPVCDLNMFFNDIDNNDVAIINAKLNGTILPLTPGVDFTLPGTNVSYEGGNLFQSITDTGLNNTTEGGIDFTFSQCIDEIEIIFYDDVAGPGVVGSEGGSYSINFPPTCDYGPTETLPPGCYDVTIFDANGSSQVITYCIEQDNCGAIGNLVWIDENADGIQDAGESGIAGVTVRLTNAASGEVFTTVTDADGGYIFDGLEGGSKKYDVLVIASTLPSGLSQTTNPTLPGADFGNQTQAGNGYSITLGDGEENLTGDFGYIWEDPNGNQGTAAIGDRVWYDANSDGVQDPGEAGIGGVTVSVLIDSDGDGIKDTPFTGAIDQNGNTGTGTTVTEPDGSYIFYNLPAGAYAIVVDPNSAPLAGLTQTGDPDDYGMVATNPDNQGESVLLAPGDVFLLEDFGYNDPAANDIGDTVYFDPNANGTQDADEPGIPGVTVALLDQNGDPIATTTTDENGEYLFPGLPDEPYTVVITDTDNVLGDLVNSGDPDGGNDEMSSVPGLLADNLDQDFGYTPASQDPGEGLIGDTVFLDYNGNGVPDPGEGIEGVTVDLHDGTGAVIASTVTDENGNYYFPGLDPTATYSVTVDPTTLPAGVAPTVDPDGGNDNTSTTDLSSDPDGIDLTQDFGYEPTPGSEGSIGNLVWLDTNVDGVNDGPNGADGTPGTDDDEPGIEGVTVDLYEDTNGNGVVDPGEPLVASTVTDANGNYLFPNLPTDNGNGVSYIVDVTDEANVIEGYWHSLGTPNTDDNSQTDTYAITLGGGNPVDNLTADFGYYIESAVLGNYVWMDTNGDGIQDPGEMPIQGAVVTLEVTYPDGSIVTVVDVTDATGHYIFENLLSDEDFDGTGTYATPGAGGGDEPYFNLSVETPVDKIPTVIDVNADGNDSEDSEDPAGTQGIAMQGFTDTMPQADPNDEPTHLTFDFGFTGRTGAIGNLVWIDENGDGLQDAGEPGISGVTVTATNPVTGDMLTTTTDADGGYLFDDLPPGKYDIVVDETTLPSGMRQSTNPVLPGQDFGNQTNNYSITIGPGEENLTGDFGYVWEDPNGNQGTAAIGDRVWLDANSDGVQDPGEAGIGGVTVSVFEDADGDGIKDDLVTAAIDQNGVPGGTTVTEPDGSYIFYNLPAGAYSIVVDGTSAPLAGLTQTGDPDDYGAPATNPDNIGESVVLAPGDVFLLEDFGYNDPAGNDLGDVIYFDPNANGTQDAGEPGIPGVTVTLLDENGDPIATTTTDENGEYLFPGLPDEPYTVVVTDTDNVLGDLVNSGDPDGGNDDMSSVPGLPADDTDQDFGYTPPGQDPGEGLIGDTVFLDYNGDGLPDPGEGIEGVTVDLHDGAGTVIATTTTDENGNYSFPGLDPTETYSITVDPSTLPPGVAPTVDSDGGNDNTSTTDLSSDPDGIDLTQDFGYEPTPGSEGSIGNLVWLDENGDGVNDGPNGPDGVPGNDDDEPGIEGVTIDLYEDTNGNGVVDAGEPIVASTVTDANGNYLFPNLPTDNGAGVSYVVDVTDEANVLEGYWHSLGTPNTNDNSQMDTYAITLGGGNPVNNLTADFGYYVEPGVLGNYVWMDTNGDGIQDPGEMPIEGAVVTLEITYPDGTVITVTDVTDANGNYVFENLLADEDYDGTGTYATPGVGGGDEPYYELSVETPDGKSPTIIDVNADGNDSEDSEDPAGTQGIAQQGLTDTTPQADPNDEPTHLTFDFGFIGRTGAIGNLVWIDENGDGLQDAGEPGIAGVTVTATNPVTGDMLTTTTDADGGYLFDELLPGKYDIVVDETTLPSGMRQSTNPVLPGQDFGNQTNNYSITIGAGEENLTGDFGYVWEDPNGNQGTAAIGDRVWLDANSDGVQDPGEAGIGGVTVSVFEDADGDGIKDDLVTAALDQNGVSGGTTVTEPDGSYIFYNLPAGAYSIVVDGTSAPLAGLTQTGDPDDYGAPATSPDNMGESVVLAPGDVFLLEDFGYNDPAGNDLGDVIYFDPNANGTQDAGEPGIPGVTVTLLDENGNPIATTTTDENGEYLFPGLPDEPYTVVVTDTDNVLGDLVNSGDPDGGNDDMSSVPGLPADDTDQDFGYTPPGQDPGEGLIGDTVFIDYDEDGAPDPGEGIEGVTVDLHDGAGTVIATTVTDENGNYYFPGLDPTETYSVTVDPSTLPPGVVPTVDPDGGNDNTSTTDLSSNPDGIDLTQDFGYEPTPGSEGSIGNLVWLDQNADGVNDGPNGPDGVAGNDDDETGIEGVTVDLYEDTNGNGAVDPGEPLVASTVTDANGNYIFPNLPTDNGAGVDYVVDVTDEANVLDGYWHSLGAPNTDDNSQTDTYAVTLDAATPNDLTADFGYYVEPAKVGNRLWFDVTDNNISNEVLTRNGIQDPGEIGIPGLIVNLLIEYPDGTEVELVTVTDDDGFYCFGNLLFDEDYAASGGANQPTYTISTNPIPGLFVDPTNGELYDLAPTFFDVNGNGNDLEDSENHAGVEAVVIQGLTDVSLLADPNSETAPASYDFGFAPVNTPVELVSFKGIEDDCKAVLTWVTATETNVSHFSVEQSANGTDFVAFGRVDAAGESQVERTYTYIDEQLTANNYYRLRIVDNDGSFEYSHIELVTADCASGVSVSDIFPNPVRNTLNIRVNSNVDHETAKIIVTDNLGRTVTTKTTELFFGTNVMDLEVNALPQATYYITIQGENGWFTQPVPFVKVK